MIKKSFGIFALIAVSGVAILAQDAPKPGGNAEEMVRVFTRNARGDVGFIGVGTTDVTKENFSTFGLSGVEGVAISNITKDSPAEKAGLQKGDVIVRFDGENVASMRKFQRLVSEVAPDHTAKITVKRGGSEKTFDVVVGQKSPMIWANGDRNMTFMEGNDGENLTYVFKTMPGMIPVPPIPPGARILGMPRNPMMDGGENVAQASILRSFGGLGNRSIGAQIMPLSKQLGDFFGVSNGNGVLVAGVEKDSPADKVGMKAGDVITAVDGKNVDDPIALFQSLGAKETGDVTITFVRGKKSQDVKITPEKASGNQKMIFRDVEDTMPGTKTVKRIVIDTDKNGAKPEINVETQVVTTTKKTDN